METYGRLHSELHSAKERVQLLQREAESQRLLRRGKGNASWRKSLAAKLHELADYLEPAPYGATKGNLL